MDKEMRETLQEWGRKEHGWCFALHGNHDEHQCHKKPGHADVPWDGDDSVFRHECYCGVWW